MIQIFLTQGLCAQIDECDEEVVQGFQWHAIKSGKTHYAATKIEGKRIFMHRLLLGGMVGGIDHADRNGLNNRRVNLRPATVSENCANRRSRYSATGFRGVAQRGDKYVAILGAPKDKGSYLGIYKDTETAALVRDCVARIRYGKFAVLNFPYRWPQ